LQDAVGEDRAITPVRLGNRIAPTRNQFVIGRKLPGALQLALVRIDPSIDFVRKQHLRMKAVAATDIQNRPFEGQSGINATFEKTLEGKRQRRPGNVCPVQIGVEFQAQRLSAFKLAQTCSITSSVMEG